jgi:hypothetical protein
MIKRLTKTKKKKERRGIKTELEENWRSNEELTS